MKYLLLIALLVLGILDALADADFEYAEYLKNGKHLSPVKYLAFMEPEEAKNADSIQYFDISKRVNEKRIAENFEIVTSWHSELKKISVNSSKVVLGPGSTSEKYENIYSLNDAKQCSKRMIGAIKKIMFHVFRKEKDLRELGETQVNYERGFKENLKLGLPCGQYLGKFGSLSSINYIEDLKVLNFIQKESEEHIQRMFNFYNLYALSGGPLEKSLWKFILGRFLVVSYLRKPVEKLDVEDLKNKFKKSFETTKEIEIDSHQSIIMVNESLLKDIDLIFEKAKKI